MTKPPTPEDLVEFMRLHAAVEPERSYIAPEMRDFARAAHALVPGLVRELGDTQQELWIQLKTSGPPNELKMLLQSARAERDQLRAELALMRGMKREAERQRDIFAAERDTHMEISQRTRVERDRLNKQYAELKEAVEAAVYGWGDKDELKSILYRHELKGK